MALASQWRWKLGLALSQPGFGKVTVCWLAGEGPTSPRRPSDTHAHHEHIIFLDLSGGCLGGASRFLPCLPLESAEWCAARARVNNSECRSDSYICSHCSGDRVRCGSAGPAAQGCVNGLCPAIGHATCQGGVRFRTLYRRLRKRRGDIAACTYKWPWLRLQVCDGSELTIPPPPRSSAWLQWLQEHIR